MHAWSNNKNANKRGTGKKFLGICHAPKLAAGEDGTTDPEKSCRYCKDTGHELKNCPRLAARNEFLAAQQPQQQGRLNWKLLFPRVMDTGEDSTQNVPSAAKFEDLLRTLTNNAVSSETMQCVLNIAVSQYPSISMEISGQKIPSLLDSESMVMLIREGYFKKHILPLLNKTTGNLTKANSLFWLSAANNEVMLVSKYFEANVMLLGFTVSNVGFLVVKDPNTLLEPQHNTQLPGVIGVTWSDLGVRIC